MSRQGSFAHVWSPLSACLALALLLLPAQLAAADWVTLGSPNPTEAKVELLSTDGNATVLDIELGGFQVEQLVEGGQTYQVVTVPGEEAKTTHIGLPELPRIGRLLAVPTASSVKVSVESLESISLEGYTISPVQAPATDHSPRGDWLIDERFYSSEEVHPRSLISWNEPGIMRDVRVVRIDAMPFQYSPSQQALTVHTKLRVTLEYGTGPAINPITGPPRSISPAADKRYRALLLNYEAMGYRATYQRDADPDYLIVTYDDFHDEMQPLADWYTAHGIPTEIVDLSVVGSTVTEIFDFITQYYNDFGIAYVLLVGDIDLLPIGDHNGDPSDFFYSLIDGGDLYADVALGRFSVMDGEDLAHQVTKTLNFLANPPDDEWLDRSFLSAYERDDYIECKEIIADTTYALDTYEFEECYAGVVCTHEQTVAAFEEGRVLINYRGHGSETEWNWSVGWDIDDTLALNNGPYTPVVWQICCCNTTLDWDTICLSEAWQSTGSGGMGGAVGNLGASRPSYTDPNHVYDKELYKASLDYGINHVGDIINYAKDVIVDYADIGIDNAYMYIYLGCPLVDLYTDPIGTLDVAFAPNIPVGGGIDFPVTVTLGGEPVEGAYVCCDMEAGGVYEIAVTDALGEAHFTLTTTSPGFMDVNVWAHNAFPADGTCMVMTTGCGVVLLDKATYNCWDLVNVTLWDDDLNLDPGTVDTSSVDMTSDSEPVPETIVMAETGPDTAEFTGMIQLDDASGGVGYLLVANGDVVTATYYDAECEGEPVVVTDTGDVDCQSPMITDVLAYDVTDTSAKISWLTDEPADSVVNYGLTTGLGQTALRAGARMEHSMTLQDLDFGSVYYFEVVSTDPSGNQGVDDNGGAYYTFETVFAYPAPGLANQRGLTFDGQNLWMVTVALNPPTDASTLFEIDPPSGSVISTIGVAGIEPSGLTFDGTNFWIGDAELDQIVEVDATGSIVSSFAAPMSEVRGLTYDGDQLWTVDPGERPPTDVPFVYELTDTGSVVSTFAPPEGDPTGMTWDGGWLYMADAATKEIYHMNVSGGVIGSLLSPDSQPWGLAWDPIGFLYLVGASNQKIYRYNVGGVTPTVTPLTATATPSISATVTASATPTMSLTMMPTMTLTPSMTLTNSMTPTVSPETPTMTATISISATMSPMLTETAVPHTETATATMTETMLLTMTATPTEAMIEIGLVMPAASFGEGDSCSLDLTVDNPGMDRDVDLYVLLDVFGEYWCYPSWRSLADGLDFENTTVAAGYQGTWMLIPTFQMPAVSTAGPFYFYAAMFEAGFLSLDHLASNGAMAEFSLE